MKTPKFINLILIALLVLSVSACDIIGGIFKTGMGVGIFIAVVVILLLVALILRVRKGHN